MLQAVKSAAEGSSIRKMCPSDRRRNQIPPHERRQGHKNKAAKFLERILRQSN